MDSSEVADDSTETSDIHKEHLLQRAEPAVFERNIDTESSATSAHITHAELQSSSNIPNEDSKEYNEEDSLTKIKEGYKEYVPVKLRRKSTSANLATLKTLPKVNCPEQIIFCVDHSSILQSTYFKASSKANQLTVMESVAKSIKHFMKIKSAIDNRHHYSLVLLNDDAQWITDFESTHDEIWQMLKDMSSAKNEQPEPDSSFDLTTLFKVIDQNIELGHLSTIVDKVFPQYVVRVIMIYGRSNSNFMMDKTNLNYKNLQRHPYFFFDSIYIHEKVSETNCVEDIFNGICNLDENGTSHIYEVGFDMNMALLFNTFAKLLGHPLQRSPQKDNGVSYELHI